MNLMIVNRPKEPQEAAKRLVEYDGEPDKISPSRLIRYSTDDGWKQTVLFKGEILLNFPAQHNDYLEQFIDLKVPTLLTALDISVIAERTKGELSARCGMSNGHRPHSPLSPDRHCASASHPGSDSARVSLPRLRDRRSIKRVFGYRRLAGIQHPAGDAGGTHCIKPELWSGEEVSFQGDFYETQKARLYTRPEQQVHIYISSLVPGSAGFAGKYGDGLLTVGGKEYFHTAGPDQKAFLEGYGRNILPTRRKCITVFCLRKANILAKLQFADRLMTIIGDRQVGFGQRKAWFCPAVMIISGGRYWSPTMS